MICSADLLPHNPTSYCHPSCTFFGLVFLQILFLMIFYLKFDYVNFGNNRFLVLLVFCLSSFGVLNEPEKLYIREYTSEDYAKIGVRGIPVLLLTILHQLCVCFDIKVS